MTNKKLYIIKCKDPNIKEVYVGTTINIELRKLRHKSAMKQAPNRKVYKFITEHGGWDNFEFEVLKDLNENDDVLKIERETIDANEKNLNTIRPHLKEEERIDYLKKWKQRNKLHCLRYRKKYQQLNETCTCGRVIRKNNIAKHKKTEIHKYLIEMKNKILKEYIDKNERSIQS